MIRQLNKVFPGWLVFLRKLATSVILPNHQRRSIYFFFFFRLDFEGGIGLTRETDVPINQKDETEETAAGPNQYATDAQQTRKKQKSSVQQTHFLERWGGGGW